MEKLEVIRVQSSSKDQIYEVLREFHNMQTSKKIDADSSDDEELKEIKFYQNSIFQYDLILILKWTSKRDSMLKTKLGYILAETLSQFGQISHSIWDFKL
ncbi:MAG: hypothetical protein HQK63_13415 [Desulfamplus sp.]|nr:hypothetical protein [Desulfamplus sp.]